ncbi:Ribosome-associated [Parasponia andersonii]|uniref:Ribosome-associated n=1 Tax=Parasponia andersonii TaxID=3476 RepID=A0A2P5DBR3_PARAD|nr:Ribosome-associated [Parasponia andersonii]
MLQLGRLVRQWPILKDYYCAYHAFHHLLLSPSLPLNTNSTALPRFSSIGAHSAHRNLHHRSRGLRLPKAPGPSDLDVENASDSESDDGYRRSRNQLKRQAQRAVRWGMDLASFSTPQIKRILSVASLDKEVLEALNLVKKLGPDVREGKRRQFNYIGKLLREVQPELMDSLIQATKDGDHSKLQALSSSNTLVFGDGDEEYEDYDSEDEEEGFHIDIATRWLYGLISKDIEITNEVYSVQNVEFDRQELRKLVRKVHAAYEKHKDAAEENKREIDAAILGARRSLTRFLRALAKQMPSA